MTVVLIVNDISPGKTCLGEVVNKLLLVEAQLIKPWNLIANNALVGKTFRAPDEIFCSGGFLNRFCCFLLRSRLASQEPQKWQQQKVLLHIGSGLENLMLKNTEITE